MTQEIRQSDLYVVRGRVTYSESDRPAVGVRVTAMDANLLADDKLGEAVTDESGNFHITYNVKEFKTLFGGTPDAYLLVHDKEERLIFSTKGATVHGVGPEEEFDVRVPGTEIDPPITRTQFKQLILNDPACFDTGEATEEAPTYSESGDTSFEELVCLGLHPTAEMLQAVVNLKKNYGYDTDACDAGSTQFVRFYIERPGGWHDLGVRSFTSYNLAGSPLPISYSVSIGMDEVRKFCTSENLVKVRAILSWTWEPPANTPNWTPPWGNRLDATVQIAPRLVKSLSIAEWMKEGPLSINKDLLALVDLDQTLKPKEPQALNYAELKTLYAEKPVPGYRFGFKEVKGLLAKPIDASSFTPMHKIAEPLPEATLAVLEQPPLTALYAGPELGEMLKYLDVTIGDTTYEELTCVGYNPDSRMIGGVIAVKLPYGYGGDLCKAGTTEYVNFWAYYDGGWQPLGGTQVNVHDLASIGSGDTVHYAVFRGVNVPEYLCQDITGMKVRAILSWEEQPTGPSFVPTWGNVFTTYIQPPKGMPQTGDDPEVRLMRINRVQIGHISDTTGRGSNPAPLFVSGDCHANDSPFGGNVYIQGDLTNKVDVFDPDTGDVVPGTHPHLYQVWVNRVGYSATQLTNKFTIGVYPENYTGTTITKTQKVQTVGTAEYYTYMESVTQAVNPRMLAVWHAGGLEEGAYEIEVRAFAWDSSTSSYAWANSQKKKVYIFNGYEHTETTSSGATFTAERPELLMTIDPPHDECGDVVVGQKIKGTYKVTDKFFRLLSVEVVPVTIGGSSAFLGSLTISTATQFPTIPTAGTTGTWELDTTGMTPCGYTVEFEAWDRALVSNSCPGHHNRVAVGFCLRAPKP